MRPVVSMPDLQAAENAKAKARRANKFEVLLINELFQLERKKKQRYSQETLVDVS